MGIAKGPGRRKAGATGRRQHSVRRKPRRYPHVEREYRVAAIERVRAVLPDAWKGMLVVARNLADTAHALSVVAAVRDWLMEVERLMRRLPPLPAHPSPTFPAKVAFGHPREVDLAAIVASAKGLRDRVWAQTEETFALVHRLSDGLDETSRLGWELARDANLMLGVGVLAVVRESGVKLSNNKLHELMADVSEAAGVETAPNELTRWRERMPAINTLSNIVRLRLSAPASEFAFDEEQYLSR